MATLPTSTSNPPPPPSSATTSSSLYFSSLPRLRASQTLSAIEEFRSCEQSLFLLESSHFPSLSLDRSMVGDSYSRMWNQFKAKDEEGKNVQRELETLTQAIEKIHQRGANNTNNNNNINNNSNNATNNNISTNLANSSI